MKKTIIIKIAITSIAMLLTACTLRGPTPTETFNQEYVFPLHKERYYPQYYTSPYYYDRRAYPRGYYYQYPRAYGYYNQSYYYH